MNRWTKQEIEELKRLYSDHTLPELSRYFGRSKNSIANKCNEIGLRGKGQPNEIRLSAEDKLWLRLNFPHMSNQICAYRLNCGRRTVVRIARKMGLEKTPQFMKECQAHTAKKAKDSHLKNGTYPAKGWYSPNLQKGEKYQFVKRNEISICETE